jgi:hypothetical protein
MFDFRPDVSYHHCVAPSSDAVFQGVSQFRTSEMRVVRLLLGEIENGLFEERQGFVDERGFSFGDTFRLDIKVEIR